MNTDYKEIAQLLFQEQKDSIETYINKYPTRTLPEQAKVTRYAPSPTGFMHIGGIYAALISERLAHQSNGLFLLRIEDTDKKREITNGITEITNAFTTFDLQEDEGMLAEFDEKGPYGPYKQSERLHIYQTFAKWLVEKDLAYPCFCSEEELAQMRQTQEENKERPGYYGKYAKHRNITLEEVKRNLEEGKKFVIRIKSNGDHAKKISFFDLIKGKVEMAENDIDAVLLKSDGYPTYHLAAMIDDRLMGITHVLRADEWLASVPLHLQIIDYFGFKRPEFGHISPILKVDNGAKRKLSKRKDPEANVKYYEKEGYPYQSVIEYLLNIANPGFEDWRKAHRDKSYKEYPIKLEKLNNSGAIFDLTKLTDISKQIIAAMSSEEVFREVILWAKTYDPTFATLLDSHKDYAIKIFGIESDMPARRKDIAKWSQVKENILYFFDESFQKMQMPDVVISPDKDEIIKRFLASFDINDDKTTWFNKVKQIATELGYASDTKTFKQNPGAYKGYVGDIAGIIRLGLTKRTNTPDLKEIIDILGKERVEHRLADFL